MNYFTISGQFIDIPGRRIYPATVKTENGIIASVTEIAEAPSVYILPGFIDAHIHIESSMLVPSAFARIAVTHGTIATVSDPHEIANVCGIEGVQYMIDNGKQTPFKFFFGAPSCVPATSFETAGAVIDAEGIKQLLANPDIWYLAEMMNYPGVLNADSEVIAKIAAAHAAGKPVDGHAPGLKGELAAVYAKAGISTDHECFTLEEALDKIAAGMNIIIREGSAAKNFEALHPLFRFHPRSLMFCSDDKHPDELASGHINQLVARAIALGYDLYDVLYTACIKPAEHYKLPVGALKQGDSADFIVVQDVKDFKVLQTYIAGQLVAENGQSNIPAVSATIINNFDTTPKTPADFIIPVTKDSGSIRVIEAIEGQLITNELHLPARIENSCIVSDTGNDILKISIVNRYDHAAKVVTAFIKNFGLKSGAIASTVAHDCHNIVAIGADDESTAAAVNALIAAKGGISVAQSKQQVDCMPLPIAGLMTDVDAHETAAQYVRMNGLAAELGTPLKAPFMTLSFMALLVIPSLKLSDKGLFDGTAFQFTDVEI